MFIFTFTPIEVLILVIIIIQLVVAAKTNDNKKWINWFSIVITAIISLVAVTYYLWNKDYLFESLFSDEFLGALYLIFIMFGGACIYAIVFLIGIIIKTVQFFINRKKNVDKNRLSTKIIERAIALPSILVFALVFLGSGIAIIKDITFTSNYNSVKKEEVVKMANFINDKYGIDVQESNCIFYRKEDFRELKGWFGSSGNAQIPFIAVFDYNGEMITVNDYKGFITDNKQLKELNKMIANYFSEKTGIDIGYVEFSVPSDNMKGNSALIYVLEKNFNKLVTNNNVDELLDCIFKQSSELGITFYIEDDLYDREVLINEVIDKFNFLKSYSNVEIVKVYGYKGELAIEPKELELPEERKGYGYNGKDSFDVRKFGDFYIDVNNSSLNFILETSFDSYSYYEFKNWEPIGDWFFKEL